MPQRHIVVEARIESVIETIFSVDVLAVAVVHLFDGGNYDLRRKCNRGDGRSRRDGTVVHRVQQAYAAWRISSEAPLFSGEFKFHICGSVACRQAPDVFSVCRPAHWVGDGVSALSISSTTRVFEIIIACGAHGRIQDGAEIDPDM